MPGTKSHGLLEEKVRRVLHRLLGWPPRGTFSARALFGSGAALALIASISFVFDPSQFSGLGVTIPDSRVLSAAICLIGVAVVGLSKFEEGREGTHGVLRDLARDALKLARGVRTGGFDESEIAEVQNLKGRLHAERKDLALYSEHGDEYDRLEDLLEELEAFAESSSPPSHEYLRRLRVFSQIK